MITAQRLREMHNTDLETYVTHVDDPHRQYLVFGPTKIKIGEMVWVDGTCYVSMDGDEMFTRDDETFCKRFTEVK